MPDHDDDYNDNDNDNNGDDVVCFQDAWSEAHRRKRVDLDDDNDYEEDSTVVADLFIDLANASWVSYRLSSNEAATTNDNNNNKCTSGTIVIRQDVEGAAHKHTGGIVWETAYLLLNYLLKRDNTGQDDDDDDDDDDRDIGRESVPKYIPPATTSTITRIKKSRTILEVGAGCGMVGLCLQRATELGVRLLLLDDDDEKEQEEQEEHADTAVVDRVILTETAEVLPNLRANVERNRRGSVSDDRSGNDDNGRRTTTRKCDLQVYPLDWTRYREDSIAAGIQSHSVDWIVGTDVVFSTRFIEPLLQTLAYLSHPHTVVYLCLQERCKDAYNLLLEKAKSGDFYNDDDVKGDDIAVDADSNCRYSFLVQDISKEVYARYPKSCGWGAEMDCKMLRFTVNLLNENKRYKKKKAEKDKKAKKKKRRRSNES